LSASLANFTAPDEFSEQVGFLRCTATARVRLMVFNQSIYWRRGFSPVGGQGVFWEAEEEMPPIRGSFEEACDVIQVRAAIPAAQLPAGARQAQVSISTRTADEGPADG
jgi:hypothetical protein